MENRDSKKNYLVFARKWRPKTFKEVVGQQHIVQALRNAVKLDRLPNAYIFSGIRGVGKTSLARIMASAINCESEKDGDPCGKCVTCDEIEKGHSIDVIEIDGASNNGVDEIREIRDSLQYAPAKCRKKIYIVDEVHMLSKAAFNAFLKTLEEPPPHTLFIFATTEISKIPETVMSRCQCFEFKALSENQIVEKLKTKSKEENIDITDPTLRMVARRADGSMRDAESLLDQVVSYSGEKIDEETAGIVLGLVSREKIWSLLDSVIGKDFDKCLKELHDLYYAGHDINVIIRELFESVRELAIVKGVKNPETILEETQERIAVMKKSVEGVSVTRLQQFYDLLLRAESQGRIARNALSVLEMTLMKMVLLDDVVRVDEIIKSLKSGGGFVSQPVQEPVGAKATAPPLRVQKPAQAAGKTATAFSSGDIDWLEVQGSVSEKSKMLAGALSSTRLTVEKERAYIHYPAGDKYILDQCTNNKDYLEEVLAKHAGRRLQLSIQQDEPAINTDAEKKNNGLDSASKKLMLSDPLINRAVDIFEGSPILDD
jgi:DNA polymerase-3 subunit gamma/tau